MLSKITLTIIGIGFAGFSGWSMYQDKQKNGKGADHIAVIRIHGEMGTGSPTGDGVIIARALREAWDNPHAKAILIEAESGGGGPSDAINIYREINELRDSSMEYRGSQLKTPTPQHPRIKKICHQRPLKRLNRRC